MDFIRQKFLVFGLSKSGISAGKALLNLGSKVYIFDENNLIFKSSEVDELVLKGAKPIFNSNYEEILPLFDVLILSPGVQINHDFVVQAKRAKKRIIGEVELGYILSKSPIIAVTGTNGKTTTVSLLDKILENAKIDRQLLGNIGTPITSNIDKISNFNTLTIAEISSFQLESISSFCPHISCILNITPDHLERHYTMENYIFLKSRITQNQKTSEFCVLNADDANILSFEDKIKAKKVWFSSTKKCDGAFIKNGKIYYFDEFIINTDEIYLKGKHNFENVLAVVAIAKILNIKNEILFNTLKTFKGAKHRIEFLGTFLNKDYYDDSKGTNTASTISAIKTMKKTTVLILGGKEKGEDYSNLFEAIKGSVIKCVILTGESIENMLKCAINSNFFSVYIEKNFVDAVKLAKFLCKENECVLLSPACSSFDSFSNYAERGDCFYNEVKKIDEK